MPIKEKPADMAGFHRNKNAALFLADGKFVCALGYRSSTDGRTYQYSEEYVCHHPLEALTIYESTFAPGLRRRFGDWLEARGYHRHTGLPLAQPPGRKPAAVYRYCPATRRYRRVDASGPARRSGPPASG